MPVDVVHLLAVAAWLGGLAALLVALYRAPAHTPVGRDAVRRFSRLAFGSVVTLAVTGVYQSWRQLGSWSAFTDTRYGQLLLVKIALVAVMVAVAFLSRRWTQRLADARLPAKAEKAESAEESVRAAATERGERAEETTGAEESEHSEGERQPAGAVPAEASAATGASATAERSGAAKESDAPDGASPAAGAGNDGAGQDAVRAAQLARQRAATEAARQKRLRDADPNRFGLRRSVLAEAGVAVVLLAVTTVLTQTEPGRTEQDAKAAAASSSSASATGQGSGAVSLTMPFDTGGTNGKGVVSVDLDPAQAGDNALHVYVEGPDGTPVDVPEVKIALTLAAQDIGPLPVAPDRITTGHWSASNVQIPMAGDWKVEVTVRTSDIDQATVSKNAQIG